MDIAGKLKKWANKATGKQITAASKVIPPANSGSSDSSSSGNDNSVADSGSSIVSSSSGNDNSVANSGSSDSSSSGNNNSTANSGNPSGSFILELGSTKYITEEFDAANNPTVGVVLTLHLDKNDPANPTITPTALYQVPDTDFTNLNDLSILNKLNAVSDPNQFPSSTNPAHNNGRNIMPGMVNTKALSENMRTNTASTKAKQAFATVKNDIEKAEETIKTGTDEDIIQTVNEIMLTVVDFMNALKDAVGENKTKGINISHLLHGLDNTNTRNDAITRLTEIKNTVNEAAKLLPPQKTVGGRKTRRSSSAYRKSRKNTRLFRHLRI